MSALLKSQTDQTMHYWMLWVAPNALQTKSIKDLPSVQRQRVLMLHPKNLGQVAQAIEVAILSDNYQMITLPRALLSPLQQQKLELLAIRHNTGLTWVGSSKQLNSASQLNLI